MLDNRNTEQWWDDRTQASMVAATTANATMAAAVPSYAWSAEPMTADPEPARRWPKVAAVATATAGAAAAGIAALVIAFSGSDAPTATPDTAPVVASTTSAPAIPAPMAAAPAPKPAAPAQAAPVVHRQASYTEPPTTNTHNCPPPQRSYEPTYTEPTESYRHEQRQQQSEQWNLVHNQFGHFGNHRSSSDRDGDDS